MDIEIITVGDLMVPLDEYVTVSQETTLYDAVLALEKAQEDFDYTRLLYRHRAILVYDDNKKIVGKVSQLDVLRALEPKYGEIGDMRKVSLAGFSPEFLKSLMERYSLFGDTLRDICAKAIKLKIKDFSMPKLLIR